MVTEKFARVVSRITGGSPMVLLIHFLILVSLPPVGKIVNPQFELYKTDHLSIRFLLNQAFEVISYYFFIICFQRITAKQVLTIGKLPGRVAGNQCNQRQDQV